MGAQTVKEMTLEAARGLVAGGQEIRPGTYAIRSRGVTVTIKQSGRPGIVKVIIMQGCAC